MIPMYFCFSLVFKSAIFFGKREGKAIALMNTESLNSRKFILMGLLFPFIEQGLHHEVGFPIGNNIRNQTRLNANTQPRAMTDI